MSRPRFRSAALSLIALVVALAAAPTANAGTLVASAGSCETSDASNPFTPWLDYMDYVEQPGGTFEAGAPGWNLGSASVVNGNEPYYVHDAGDSKSLAIPGGQTVTSSTMCVGINEPTLRFFARSSGGNLLSKLLVDVQFEDALGNVLTLPIGTHPRGPWSPTLTMPVVANLLPLLSGDKTPVRFRFTALGSADWQLDDVYVDPRRQ